MKSNRIEQIIADDPPNALWYLTLMTGMRMNLDNGRVPCNVQRTTLTCTWRAEKWVTQPTETQPVPFTDVEISLQHQAQPERLHYQTPPQSAPSSVHKLNRERVIFTTSCLYCNTGPQPLFVIVNTCAYDHMLNHTTHANLIYFTDLFFLLQMFWSHLFVFHSILF